MSIDLNFSDRFCQLAQLAVRLGASDIHLASNEPAWFRIGGEICPATTEGSPEQKLWSDVDTRQLLEALIGESGLKSFQSRGSMDGAFAMPMDGSVARFRFNIFRTRSSTSIALRLLDERFRSLAELGLSDQLYELGQLKDGLVLIAGPTGSGKSTTLAALIDRVNRSRAAHIITIEDPVEYVHTPQRSIISQRQVGLDTPDFDLALVDALRQDPDVILVGELRALQTIRTAIAAAETGHLVFATVHAGDAVGAIERLVSVFPGDEQVLMHRMLSGSLRAVIAQHLLPRRVTADGNDSKARVLASEVLLSNPAITNLIAGGNLNQIRSILETSSAAGMYTLDTCLARLYRNGLIDQSTAMALARNPRLLLDRSRAI